MIDANQIRLPPLEEKDAESMLEWLRDESVTEYLTINGSNMTLDNALSFIEKAKDESEILHRAIVDSEDDYLGTISLKNIDMAKKEAEYAITLHPKAMGTGAATSASKLIVQLAIDELGLDRVYLNVLRINKRAVRLYEKLGYIYTHSTYTDFNGEELELMWMEVTL